MKAMFVYENMGFERGQDPRKAMNVGISAVKMMDRSPKFNDPDYKRAEEFLRSTGLVEITTSDRQRKNGTLKFTIRGIPYWGGIGYKYAEGKKLYYGKIDYLIYKTGYLRKLTPTSDRLGVVIKEPYSTYLDLAKRGMISINKDLIKKEKIEKGRNPRVVIENVNFERGKDLRKTFGMREHIKKRMQVDGYQWFDDEMMLVWAYQYGHKNIIDFLKGEGVSFKINPYTGRKNIYDES